MEAVQTEFSMATDLNALTLVEDLCDAYERHLTDLDENAPEMVRVIRAIAAGKQVILHNGSSVARVLTEEFSERVLLWRHVSLEVLPPEVH